MTMDAPAAPPVAGVAEDMGGGIRRILAPNPSAMTFWGTNTYLLGDSDVAVIDPGPDNAGHMRAILGALRDGARIGHIFVTHAHLDHAPLARRLSRATGAPVCAFGPATAGRSAVMTRLAGAGLMGGGEGVDRAFVPDVTLSDGQTVAGDGWTLTALWTPGHFGNHLCFATGDAVFTGDLVMGWASSLVSPPDGDLGDFMASCARLADIPARVFHPGHGAPVTAPRARLDWLMAHRRAREAAIRSHLGERADTAAGLARRIYTDIAPALQPAAARNVLAHLIDLTERGLARPRGPLTATATFETGPETTGAA